MYAKVHQHTNRTGRLESTAAVCDANLIGKVLKAGVCLLDLATYKGFYVGQKVTEKQAIEILRGATHVNVVGKKSLEAARKALGVDPKAAKKIKRVPHLQVYRI